MLSKCPFRANEKTKGSKSMRRISIFPSNPRSVARGEDEIRGGTKCDLTGSIAEVNDPCDRVVEPLLDGVLSVEANFLVPIVL